MAARIQILPDRLISQIAAGEVVERPASVIKELLENSFDAGAENIEIELVSGGKRYIRVADDGEGMGSDDALLAFDQHATSKIGSFEDLQEVGSFGFRGEALASIAAVSRVELVTSTSGGDAHRVAIDGGRIRLSEPAARSRGTTIEISSLFFNVPARRRFLKSPRTELRRCLEVLQGYALARPTVRLAVSHEGRTLLDLTAAGAGLVGVGERVRQVFGAGFAERLVTFEADEPGVGAVAGLVGDTEAVRRRPFVFVNGRLLRDRAVLATFYRAVRDEWKSDHFPPLFLFIDVPPSDLDVNVHPQKAEVRFRSPAIIALTSGTLREALLRGRREEPAFLRDVPTGTLPDLSWRGIGESRPEDPEGSRLWPGSVGEAATGPTYGAGIAQTTYPPSAPRHVPLSGSGDRPRSLRLLGQYKGSLLLLEGPEGLYLVDQHAAHERILYERFRSGMNAGTPTTQRLLEPLLLEVGPAQSLRLEDLAGRLAGFGFEISRLSGNSIGVHEVPAALSAAEAEHLLLEIASGDPPTEGEDIETFGEQLLVSLAASQACRSAVKIHHRLTFEEMERLLDDLFASDQPYSCPHGRPTVLKISDADLEHRFGRR